MRGYDSRFMKGNRGRRVGVVKREGLGVRSDACVKGGVERLGIRTRREVKRKRCNTRSGIRVGNGPLKEKDETNSKRTGGLVY
jgi:hypothetical protein